MQYPTSMQMGARTLSVNVVTTPIVVAGQDRPGTYVGKFENKSSTITVYDDGTEVTRDIGGDAFVHETIEAADAIYDLKLPHQTIQTLAAAMYQAYASGKVSFVN